MDRIDPRPGMGYYDRTGKQITLRQWAEAVEADWDAARRVAQSFLAGCRISTVCLGMDHAFGGGEPIIFETMIFWPNGDDMTWRYHTEEQAADHHKFLVRRIDSRWRRYRSYIWGLDDAD